jgi:hypothetical protein
MTEARCRHDWQQTCEVLALLANIHRKPHSPVIRADALNPYNRKGRRPTSRQEWERLPKITMAELKTIWTGQPQPQPQPDVTVTTRENGSR